MAPPFEIQSVRNTGPTDRGGDDSLWLVTLSESEERTETLGFAVSASKGVPTADEVEQMVVAMANGFDNDRSALDQFRERKVAHPKSDPSRRVIWLTHAP